MNGIPNLLKKAPKAFGIALLGKALGALYDALFPQARWGIYLTGTSTRVQEFTSVLDVEIRSDCNIPDYVIETGSFVSYNKVDLPNLYRVKMTQDGTPEQRAKTLKWLEDKKGSTELFDVVTPEYVWQKVTLVAFNHLRNAKSGAAMLTIECVFQQVREMPAKYPNPKIQKAEYAETSPTVKTYPIENRTVQATELPPL